MADTVEAGSSTAAAATVVASAQKLWLCGAQFINNLLKRLELLLS
jgi:hypothetical protein